MELKKIILATFFVGFVSSANAEIIKPITTRNIIIPTPAYKRLPNIGNHTGIVITKKTIAANSIIKHLGCIIKTLLEI